MWNMKTDWLKLKMIISKQEQVHTSVSHFTFWKDGGSLLCGVCLCSRTRLSLLRPLTGFSGCAQPVQPLFWVIHSEIRRGTACLLSPEWPRDTRSIRNAWKLSLEACRKCFGWYDRSWTFILGFHENTKVNEAWDMLWTEKIHKQDQSYQAGACPSAEKAVFEVQHRGISLLFSSLWEQETIRKTIKMPLKVFPSMQIPRNYFKMAFQPIMRPCSHRSLAVRAAVLCPGCWFLSLWSILLAIIKFSMGTKKTYCNSSLILWFFCNGTFGLTPVGKVALVHQVASHGRKNCSSSVPFLLPLRVQKALMSENILYILQ